MEINEQLTSIIYSKPAKIVLSNTKGETKRIDIKKVNDNYLTSEYRENKVFNKNLNGEKELLDYISSRLRAFRQVNITTKESLIQFKESKSGKILVSKLENNFNKVLSENFNREKNYILKEDESALPLIDMGILSASGKLLSSGQKKFKQINRFVELLNDSFKDVPKKLNIIDFGCGKSYLTFVVYYFFKKIKNVDVTITGLDLKEDVINNCNALPKSMGTITSSLFAAT